jgi:hypothetical protein
MASVMRRQEIVLPGEWRLMPLTSGDWERQSLRDYLRMNTTVDEVWKTNKSVARQEAGHMLKAPRVRAPCVSTCSMLVVSEGTVQRACQKARDDCPTR